MGRDRGGGAGANRRAAVVLLGTKGWWNQSPRPARKKKTRAVAMPPEKEQESRAGPQRKRQPTRSTQSQNHQRTKQKDLRRPSQQPCPPAARGLHHPPWPDHHAAETRMKGALTYVLSCSWGRRGQTPPHAGRVRRQRVRAVGPSLLPPPNLPPRRRRPLVPFTIAAPSRASSSARAQQT